MPKRNSSSKKARKQDYPKNRKRSRDTLQSQEDASPREVWSKSKKKRMRMLRAKQLRAGETKGYSDEKNCKDKQNPVPSNRDDDEKSNRLQTKSSSLQQSFKARLSGSRFRILNEELYTSTSSSAFKRFKSNPDLYEQYHEGFRHQVQSWPVNPIDVIVSHLKGLAAARNDQQIVVADFGCGDAELAKQLLRVRQEKKCPFQVHSFDLVAACDLVTACDMAHVPLQPSSVDVAIFCLSLMGTNLADFIREAHRVLKESGKLKIAEVRSRFETRSGKEDLQQFVDVLDQLGFECVGRDRSNKMFVLLELEKNEKKPKNDLAFTARPCIYKRR